MLAVSQRVQPGVYTLIAGIVMPSSSKWALSARLSTNRWCRQFLLPATKLCPVTSPSGLQWLEMSTMQWHSSCRFAQRIRILSRSTEERGLSCSHLAHASHLYQALCFTARHVQALRADLRAETLSHAAELTSHTTLLVFGKSEFIGQDEAGHGRSTVGLTRATGTAIILARWIRVTWLVLCKQPMFTTSLSLTGSFLMPRSPSLLAHRTLLLLCDPLKPPAGLRCHLRFKSRIRKNERFFCN